MPRLFLDLDGFMADFEAAVTELFGRPCHTIPDARRWQVLAKTPEFYANLPWMPDGKKIWNAVKHLSPTVLTGCPKTFTEQAAVDKRAWCARELGPDVPVITCLSANKSDYLEPGDVLADDWPQYADKWVTRGGIFVHHTHWRTTLTELASHGFDVKMPADAV